MSTGADRTPPPVPPTSPPRSAVPPRPSAPPRPRVPPKPGSPPAPPGPSSDGTDPTPADGGADDAATGARSDGEQHKEDEHSAPMPYDTEAERDRPAGSSASSTPSAPASASGRDVPAGQGAAPGQGAGRSRPPLPTAPPQPPPPRGEPLSASDPWRSARPTAPPGVFPEAPQEPVVQPGEEYVPGLPAQPPYPARQKPRPAPRTVAAATALVLGVGLLGGAGAGAWLGSTGGGDDGFDNARSLWHDVPVNDLFPSALDGKGAGPGGADRHWRRVAVAHDSGCRNAFDPLLAKALSSVGCARLVRATYADETSSSVTTVGMLFTRADAVKMRALRKQFAVQNLTERTDLMPRPYSARGTVSADFGDAQRASWTLRVLSDAPIVVYAVSGFADGRVVSDPQSAAEATERGETSAAAQAGLGHDAQGIADRIEHGLRKQSVFGSEVDD